MPLNPEEVVNKRFSPTKFRQGYDEEEVDEFLDEVVAELRRLNAENDELRSKLSACESRVSELSRTATAGRESANAPGGAAAAASSPAGSAATASPATEPDTAPNAHPTREAEPVAARSAPAAAQAPAAQAPAAQAPAPAAQAPAAQAPAAQAPAAQAPAAQAPAAQAPAAQAPAASGPESAAGMLVLAQRLHDEYVQAGKDEGAKIVSEAQEHATRLVHEAEERQRRTLGDLERNRQVLERKVEELRSFEREYRARLKAYLENQLRELETRAPVAGRTPGAAGSADGGGQGAGAGQDTPRFPFGG
ncbi:MAG TPA: DivIVA domain-containing protein [Actinomycetales bacterium]|nr:DivIVA domain-containing protein [Actinomycetales bacterium]